MTAPFVSLVAALAVLWMAGEPFGSRSRGLTGDAMALAFAAPLALAWVGLRRYGVGVESGGFAGPVRFVELAAREPVLVGLLGAGVVFAASPPWDVHLVFVGGAVAWLVLGRVIDGPRARPYLEENVVVLAITALLAGGFASGASWWPMRVAGGAFLAAGLWLVLTRRPVPAGPVITRRLLGLVAIALCIPLHSFLLECLGTLQPIEFAIVPFLWIVLWALSETLRGRAERRGALDVHGMVHRLTPALGVTLAPWAWLLLAHTALDTAAVWTEYVVPVLLLALPLFAIGAVVVGSATTLLVAPEPAWDARRLSDVRTALLPLAAPLLVFACLRFAPLPAAWSAASEPRGLLAMLAPQFVLPLAGAALIAAVGIDRLAGRWRPVFFALGAAAVAWGATAYPPALPTGFPVGFERAGLDVHGLRPWVALLIALAALATWQRLAGLAKDRRSPLAALAAAPVVAVPAALVLVPAHGPLGALWAASAGLAAVVALDASRVQLTWRRTEPSPH